MADSVPPDNSAEPQTWQGWVWVCVCIRLPQRGEVPGERGERCGPRSLAKGMGRKRGSRPGVHGSGVCLASVPRLPPDTSTPAC